MPLRTLRGLGRNLVLAGLAASTTAVVTAFRRRAERVPMGTTADLQASDERLRHTNEAMRNLLGGAAHDLRNPLTSIYGYSATLAGDDGPISKAERAQAVRAIRRQIEHMTLLIDDLLAWSDMEGGGLAAHPQQVQVARSIRRAVDDLGLTAVTIRCPQTLWALVDPSHLRRMLENYLTNAVKYGAPPIQIEARQAGDEVVVEVTDHGTGIPAEFVPRLFDTFARADTPAVRAQRGTGLGLSIVRTLAEANGGSAYHQSEVHNGTCFGLRLPAVRPPSHGRRLSRPSEPDHRPHLLSNQTPLTQRDGGGRTIGAHSQTV